MAEGISVIIPVYNGARTLDACLEAIEANAWPASQVVVVDDASTDDSTAIARRHACQVLEESTNRGAGAARNAGARAAQYDVLVFIDADVLVAADALGRIAAQFETRPDIAAIVGVYAPVGMLRSFWSRYKQVYLAHSFMSMPERIGTTNTSITAVRRDAFFEVGGFEEHLRTSEDDVFGAALVRAGFAITLDKTLQVQHDKDYTCASLLMDDLKKSTNLAYHFLRLKLHPPPVQTAPFGHHRNALLWSVPAAYAVAGSALWLLAAPASASLAALGAAATAYAALNASYWRFVAQYHPVGFTARVALFSVVEMLVAGVAILRGATRLLGERAAPRGPGHALD